MTASADFDVEGRSGQRGNRARHVAVGRGRISPAPCRPMPRWSWPTTRTAANRTNMVRSLDDPKFVGRVAAVDNDLVVPRRIRRPAERNVSRHGVRLSGAGAGRCGARCIQSTRRSRRRWSKTCGTSRPSRARSSRCICRLNKEVAEARLVGTDGEKIELKQDRNDAKRVPHQLDARRVAAVQSCSLVDRDGRGNRLPAEIVVNVTPNRPPKIAIERPGRDVEVSPLEELQLKATVSDDFGVVAKRRELTRWAAASRTT